MGTLKGAYWNTPEGKEFQKTSPITNADGSLNYTNLAEAKRRKEAWEAAQSGGASSIGAPASAAPVLTSDEGGEASNVKKKTRGKAGLKVKSGGTGSTGGTGLSV